MPRYGRCLCVQLRFSSDSFFLGLFLFSVKMEVGRECSLVVEHVIGPSPASSHKGFHMEGDVKWRAISHRRSQLQSPACLVKGSRVDRDEKDHRLRSLAASSSSVPITASAPLFVAARFRRCCRCVSFRASTTSGSPDAGSKWQEADRSRVSLRCLFGCSWLSHSDQICNLGQKKKPLCASAQGSGGHDL